MAYAHETVTGQASTNTYATLLELVAKDASGPVSITMVEDGTNSVDWQVLGANASDYSDAVVVEAEASVSDTTDSHTSDMAHYRYYKAQVKSTAGGSHGSVSAYGTVK